MCVVIVVCAFICIHTVHVLVNLFYGSVFFSLPLNVNLASVWVDKEAREGAVLVLVSSVNFPSVQLHANLIPDVQMQDHTV